MFSEFEEALESLDARSIENVQRTFQAREELDGLTSEQYQWVLDLLRALGDLTPNYADPDPRAACVESLNAELETWPEEKEQLAHRFIKCIVLRESEDEAMEMAKHFSPDQLEFLKSHISEVLRLYGNQREPSSL